MKKRIILYLGIGLLGMTAVTGCSGAESTSAQSSVVVESSSETEIGASEVIEESTDAGESASQEVETEVATEVAIEVEDALEDGVYYAEFKTDSAMFHVNEMMNNQGVLTVENGQMTIHVTLSGTGILNLYPGLAEDAQAEGAVLLQPSEDEVLYDDGLTDIAYGFDIPVPYLDGEFDVALIGKKGVWYDHKVYVTNVQTADFADEAVEEVSEEIGIEVLDGEYMANVTLTGGSGKATVESPCKVVIENGEATATIVWSSKNYDYMIVDGEKYLNEAEPDTQSTFTIPVAAFSVELPVIGDTVAMSTPHEVEYMITFDLVD